MPNDVRIALVVAVADNGVIGQEGGLPWRISSELKHFKGLTMGKPMVMGRKTFESIGKPLEGRDTIVITRNPHFEAAGIHVVDGLEAALEVARRLAKGRQADEVLVVGGGEIYRTALPVADRVYLSEIHAEPEGDTRFPTLDAQIWQETSRERRDPGPKDSAAFSFVVLDRVVSDEGRAARQETPAD